MNLKGLSSKDPRQQKTREAGEGSGFSSSLKKCFTRKKRREEAKGKTLITEVQREEETETLSLPGTSSS